MSSISLANGIRWESYFTWKSDCNCICAVWSGKCLHVELVRWAVSIGIGAWHDTNTGELTWREHSDSNSWSKIVNAILHLCVFKNEHLERTCWLVYCSWVLNSRESELESCWVPTASVLVHIAEVYLSACGVLNNIAFYLCGWPGQLG